MKLGLGTGSTAAWMVRCLAERVREEGLKVTCVATSTRARRTLARELGLKVVGMDDVKWLDLTIDGADEIRPRAEPDQGRRGGAVAGKDRGDGQRPDDRDRGCGQGSAGAGGLCPAGRGGALRLADHARP
jgi:hypothetical protein